MIATTVSGCSHYCNCILTLCLNIYIDLKENQIYNLILSEKMAENTNYKDVTKNNKLKIPKVTHLMSHH